MTRGGVRMARGGTGRASACLLNLQQHHRTRNTNAHCDCAMLSPRRRRCGGRSSRTSYAHTRTGRAKKYAETDVGITEFINHDMAGIGGVIKALWSLHACVHALFICACS